ncbi:MAG TPA: N-acetylglucosamine-6-phosphate deacetylase [Thermoleophilaceae bacterium]|nr:N-acetylglucosamine-6-phosphate deacetylase [Thermoleophilaceae bacterium]
MELGVSAAIVDGALVPGDLRVEGGTVTEVGLPPASTARGTAVPGFVDLHINGFAGVDFLTAEPGDYGTVGRELAATGVTAYLPTFVSSPLDTYRRALRAVGDASADAGARLLGVHLEGPFISPRWAGAHDPRCIREPDLALAADLCDTGPVRVVTLAPELPGGLELVEYLSERDVVVSCGHSDADAQTAHRAFDRGARAVTHVYNAHRRWQPRDPGLAGAALVRDDVTVQAIVDDVHLAPETAYGAFLAARERFCLVTDAIAGAGLAPRDSRLGHRTVHVRDGEVRLPDGRLAGSLLTMDRAVANLVAKGASLAAAVHAASRAPALLIGRPDLGRIAVGHAADIAVLDDDLRVIRALVAGEEAGPAPPDRRPHAGDIPSRGSSRAT